MTLTEQLEILPEKPNQIKYFMKKYCLIHHRKNHGIN